MFYLGTHKPNWLGLVDVPLFISRRTLAPRKSLPRARGRWGLDSGGFSELSLYGRWTITPAEYAAEVRRYRDEIGGLDWAAPQDWMCEPVMTAKTGRAVREHQRLTVENYLELRAIAPDLPFIPVLQGQAVPEYLEHVDMYTAAGVDLAGMPTVGVGSVCRRQATDSIWRLFWSLQIAGLRNLHAFGMKTLGLERVHPLVQSSDSLAWSFDARRSKPLAGCPHEHCVACLPYALGWRERMLARVSEDRTSIGLMMAA